MEVLKALVAHSMATKSAIPSMLFDQTLFLLSAYRGPGKRKPGAQVNPRTPSRCFLRISQYQYTAIRHSCNL
jgi:hypothetical protein